MAINTTLTVTLTSQFMRDLGFVFDGEGNTITSPSGIWSSAIWFGNNDADQGYLQLINDGSILAATPQIDPDGVITGFKFSIPAFTDNAVKGGVMYIALASDTSLTVDPFANLTEGEINNLQQARDNNFTFGTFEFTLQGGPDDQGDLTAISTFGLPMSATSIVNGAAIDSVGYQVSGSTIWSAIASLGTTAAPSVYTFDTTKGPLSGNAFAISPTTAVGGSFTAPSRSALPFAATDWDQYLDTLANMAGSIARISGTYNGAVAPVNNWVSTANNVQLDVWHNAGFFDYKLSYETSLNIQVNGASTTTSGFLLSPTAASQVKGYIVIPKGDEANLSVDWNGGLANSIYSTLGMAQVYAQDPSQFDGQSPFLFQNATSSNNGSATDFATTSFFNVGANTQWGKVFTQLLTGLAAGYLGSTGEPLNPLQTDGGVDLSQSWNWDPTYAFDRNLSSQPYGNGPAFQFTDNYAKIFFQNSNVYGDMYSDNLMSLYTQGSPLLTLSNPAGGNVDEVNITVFSVSDTPTGYVTPTINNYPWEPGTAPTLVAPSEDSANTGTYTLNFINPAGGDGQQSFVVDDTRMTFAIRVWDPTLNEGTGGFSNSAELPAFPTATITISGFAGQEIVEGTILTATTQTSTTRWTVVSQNNVITPSGGSTTNGDVSVTVSANAMDASVDTTTIWQSLALPFPVSIAYVNNAASQAGPIASDPQTVTLTFSGDAGAQFDSGYIVDSLGHRWSFLGGTIDSVTGTVAVTATAGQSGVSVPANETWSGLFQFSPVETLTASLPGVFWNNYTASYDNGELSFVNQNVTSQVTGELQLINLPLADKIGDTVWYQFVVTDTETNNAKTFNFYPQFGANSPASQNIDGGASISLGTITDQYTINFAGSGTDALPGDLFIANQVKGHIPLQGTPYAPTIGIQASSFYQYLGQSVDFTAATTNSGATQPTAGSNTMTGLAPTAYVFSWTGLNPTAITDGSIGQWTNKTNGLDIVQINIVDTLDSSFNKTVFAQADIDGQWLTGTSAVIDVIGAPQDLNLLSKPISLVAGRTYQINYQEFLLSDLGLSGPNPAGVAPISKKSEVLIVSIDGTSAKLDIADTENHDFVYALYDGLLDRMPDRDGFLSWVHSANRNNTNASSDGTSIRAKIVSDVMKSNEFQLKWTGLSDEAWVDTAYAFVLDRTPDEAGKNYWLDQLRTGQITDAQLLHSFIESPESQQLTDLVTQSGYWVTY